MWYRLLLALLNLFYPIHTKQADDTEFNQLYDTLTQLSSTLLTDISKQGSVIDTLATYRTINRVLRQYSLIDELKHLRRFREHLINKIYRFRSNYTTIDSSCYEIRLNRQQIQLKSLSYLLDSRFTDQTVGQIRKISDQLKILYAAIIQLQSEFSKVDLKVDDYKSLWLSDSAYKQLIQICKQLIADSRANITNISAPSAILTEICLYCLINQIRLNQLDNRKTVNNCYQVLHVLDQLSQHLYTIETSKYRIQKSVSIYPLFDISPIIDTYVRSDSKTKICIRVCVDKAVRNQIAIGIRVNRFNSASYSNLNDAGVECNYEAKNVNLLLQVLNTLADWKRIDGSIDIRQIVADSIKRLLYGSQFGETSVMCFESDQLCDIGYRLVTIYSLIAVDKIDIPIAVVLRSEVRTQFGIRSVTIQTNTIAIPDSFINEHVLIDSDELAVLRSLLNKLAIDSNVSTVIAELTDLIEMLAMRAFIYDFVNICWQYASSLLNQYATIRIERYL